MSAILVKMPPAIRSAEAPSDSPMAKPRKQMPTMCAIDEQQDDDHHHQLERDQEQADRHARTQRNVDHVPRLAPQRSESRAGVGVGVDADAVPGHPVRTHHADQGEGQNGQCGLERLVLQPDEVIHHGHRDDGKEHHQELALLDQVRLAGLEDDLGDIEHRLVGRQILDLPPQKQADAQRADDDERSVKQQVPGVDLGAGDREIAQAEIRNGQIGFARHGGRAQQ